MFTEIPNAIKESAPFKAVSGFFKDSSQIYQELHRQTFEVTPDELMGRQALERAVAASKNDADTQARVLLNNAS